MQSRSATSWLQSTEAWLAVDSLSAYSDVRSAILCRQASAYFTASQQSSLLSCSSFRIMNRGNSGRFPPSSRQQRSRFADCCTGDEVRQHSAMPFRESTTLDIFVIYRIWMGPLGNYDPAKLRSFETPNPGVPLFI
jgi:hypothetical protein